MGLVAAAGMNRIRLATAFILRDPQLRSPWRWIFSWIDSVLAVMVWYFGSRFFRGDSLVASSSETDYFSFSLIGIALSQYIWRGAICFLNKNEREMKNGAMEMFYLSAWPFPWVLLNSSFGDFVAATLNALVILGVGAICFGADLHWQGVIPLAAVFFLISLAMGGFALLASAWMIAFKRANNVRGLVLRAMPILSGSFFPVYLFPGWLKDMTLFLPMTHALTLSRGILVPSGAVPLGSAWVALGGLAVVSLLGGWMAVNAAVQWARSQGGISAE